ncbi:MAG TPA: response regulator [Thermoanaerobaculia bacterium]|nr:response regulator [Thermoanaerobaculia bacterium]
MDAEFADLVPLFVEESRERLEKLALRVPRLALAAQAAPALAEAKRELHTLKGAGRMMRLAGFAELCHAAEELLQAARPGALATVGMIPLLTRVADALAAMVDEVARGAADPPADPELLAILALSLPPAGAAAPAPAVAPEPAGADPSAAGASNQIAGAAERSLRPGPVPAGAVGARVDTQALDAVAERATEVRIMALAARQAVVRLDELARLAEHGMREPQPAQLLAVLAAMLRRMAVDLERGQRRLIRAADEQLEQMLALQLQPLRGSLLALARYARELARSLKREVEVEIEGEQTRLDRRILRELDEALLHLVRNAVDHGIEAPEVREARGKPRAGRLRIRAVAAGRKVSIAIADDGGGIDPRQVLQQAVQTGLVDAAAAAALPHEQVLRLLFSPGFSTRRRVSETSGRGVGLDAVAAAVNRVGGEVFLGSEPRRGTTVTLEVPFARRGESMLLVRVGKLRLALPAAAVLRATRLAPEAVVERDGQSLAVVGDQLVPFVPLAQLYGQPAAARQLLLQGAASGQPIAVAVDEVLEEQEVMVRPLTRKVATDRLLEGVALLASGEPVGVLSPSILARHEYSSALPAAAGKAVVQRLRVLLVDDSLVTREMERRLLEDAGFEVAGAADAAEALSRLGEGRFDCLVTDIEMAGMDGFELTSQLRGMEQFAHLPIVVVSTRERPEDRLRGLKAGADAYLTKQGLDAGELIHLVRRLSGR